MFCNDLPYSRENHICLKGNNYSEVKYLPGATNNTSHKPMLFCHTMDLPGMGKINGEWDLRVGLHEYLGKVNFRGKRVLDVVNWGQT